MSFLCKNELFSPLSGCEIWRFTAKLSVDVFITFHFYLCSFTPLISIEIQNVWYFLDNKFLSLMNFMIWKWNDIFSAPKSKKHNNWILKTFEYCKNYFPECVKLSCVCFYDDETKKKTSPAILMMSKALLTHPQATRVNKFEFVNNCEVEKEN